MLEWERKERCPMKKLLTSVVLLLAVVAALFTGAVTADAAETMGVGVVTTTSGGLNVRSGPGIGYGILTSLPRGGYVTLVGRSGDWYRVEYGAGQYGYCSAAYLPEASFRTATVDAEGYRLNIRAGAGTGYAIVSRYADRSTALVLSSAGGWAKVLFDGTKIGYVSEEYLVYEGRTAVTLNVPRYAQNDSRWASVRLGSSRYTIGGVGCTTCSMAMVESTVRGYTVTPAMMAAELTYSSSGTLYWPSCYSAYFGNDYLTVAYQQLKQGRPVMIGGFTPAGAQHWVVITGFTGGDLIPEHFTVNDPGAYSRSTLAAFQSKYSVFYKIMIRT